MSTKQSPQNKKETPSILNRSVMLTRFKLSQQKRKLREKDRRMTHITQLLKKPYSSTTDDKTKAVTSPKQNKPVLNPPKKSKMCQKSQSKNLEREEFYPNKVKRNSVAKKIVLKPKHELKLIGGTNGVNKRKLNVPQKGIKSPPPKRYKTGHKFNSSTTITDRSQSPIYSELSFEEVIRIADENQNLDDEDLLEILTCPSPVWWEDPPNDGYMEDPITKKLKSKPSSLPIKQCKTKSSRKKKPHKIILELPQSKENEAEKNTVDVGSIVHTAAFNNISNSDDKFKNKRSKLENLLSTIKTKLSGPKETSEQKSSIDNSKESSPDGAQKKISESSECGLCNEISLQDDESLKLLENMEIPIEGKCNNNSSKIEGSANVKFPYRLDNLPMTASEHLKIFKNNLSKSIPRLVKNKKIKILNIKKISANLSQNKDKCTENVLLPAFSNKNTISSERLEPNTSLLNQDKLDCNTSTSLQFLNVNKTNKEFSIIDNLHSSDAKGDTIESKISLALSNKDKKKHYTQEEVLETTPQESESEEYITVFKILSNDTDIPDDNESENINNVGDDKETSVLFNDLSQIEDTNKSMIIDVIENETADKDKNKINSYYKKCKDARRASKKITKLSSEDDKDIKITNSNNENNENELCNECNIDTKKSIIVSNTNDVKYCLKCSSIFDLDQCNYCVRKEMEKHQNQLDNSNSEVEVNKEYIKDDV